MSSVWGSLWAVLDNGFFGATGAGTIRRRYTRFLLARFLLAAVAIALSGCATIEASPEPRAVPADSVVYVIGRGWHTDIGLPVQEIIGPMARLERGLPGVRYLTFGFGERQFLLRHKRTLGAMMSALLPSQSAVLMTALSASPQAAFGARHVVMLRVSPDGLHRIEASIWRELEKSPDDEPIPLAEGPYAGSIFYASRDTYDGLFTCNSWTAATLRAGGVAVPTAGVLFANQVMRSAREIAARERSVSHD
jgi:uncharacterized protein (TIGR02117 family)